MVTLMTEQFASARQNEYVIFRKQSRLTDGCVNCCMAIKEVELDTDRLLLFETS